MNKKFDPENEASSIVAWWHSLYPAIALKREGAGDIPARPGDAGARAAMRRAETPFQVMLLPAFHDLMRQIRDRGAMHPGRLTDARLENIALAAGVICSRQNDETEPTTLARALGHVSKDERPAMSPARFRSLMAALDSTDGEERMRALRGALALAKGRNFNVTRLVRDIINYTDRTRIDWTFDYYGTDREGPAENTISETGEISS